MRWISVVAILPLFWALSSGVLAESFDRATVSLVVTVPEANEAVDAARISACKQARNASRAVCRSLNAPSSSSSGQQAVATPSSQSSGQTSSVQAAVQLQSISANLQSGQDGSQGSSADVVSALGSLLSLSTSEQSQFASSQIQSSETEGQVRFTIASI
ncbi:MAG: hypothetical protein HWD83_06970 [Gammaproteobacteria bacterium]|nr:hypothetical protein [Gammaproteobacteria bacterium]